MFDIARDPDASTPQSHQHDELGYSIYGTGEGQVNIEQGMQGILDQVLAQGFGSMANFWEIEALFAQKFDGHIGLPRLLNDFTTYELILVPQRNVGVDQKGISPEFQIIIDGLDLRLTYSDFVTGTSITKQVLRLNGQSPRNFFTQLAADGRTLNLNLQTVGARLNLLMRSNAGFNGILARGIPNAVFPDSFVVQYTDGTSEMFYTGIRCPPLQTWARRPTDGTIFMDRFEAEAFLNQPGDLYFLFETAVEAITDASSSRRKSRISVPKLEKLDIRTATLETETERKEEKAISPQSRSFVFDLIWADLAAFIIEDDYAVLKLNNFQMSSELLLVIWENLITFAQDRGGRKKLILDLSANGGGFVESGYLCVFLMFPNVSPEYFQNQWDVNWNQPMTKYLETLIPLLDSTLTALIEISFAVRITRSLMMIGLDQSANTSFMNTRTSTPRWIPSPIMTIPYSTLPRKPYWISATSPAKTKVISRKTFSVVRQTIYGKM